MVSLRELNEIISKELQVHKKHWANSDGNRCYFPIGCLHNHRHVVLVSLTSALVLVLTLSYSSSTLWEMAQSTQFTHPATRRVSADLNDMLRIVTHFPKPGHSTDVMVHLETLSVRQEVLE